MTDYRNAEQKLLDAIFGTPTEEIEAYNSGRAHVMSEAESADSRWYEEDSPVAEAFWRGVQEGTASVQRLLDSIDGDRL